MLKIGSHISSAKGYVAMGKKAEDLGASTFAFFTRNPRGGSIKALDERDLETFKEQWKAKGFSKIVAHAPYTLNACSDKAEVRQFAREAFAEDLQRMEYLPGNYYNFHPGSHVGQGKDTGIAYIAEMLNLCLQDSMTTTVLLETMAGKGSEIGKSFEELAEILEHTVCQKKIGVCLDTCHVWDAGYDIVRDLDGVLSAFDQIIGLEKLKAVHLNDSMNPLGSHKDRHARIGEGQIGFEALVRVINHPKLSALPFILETPNEDAGWKREIAILREAFRG